jgi:hypothetical protein
MAVFYEQFKTGWLTFEPVGSLEGVLLSAALIALSVFEPVYSLFTYHVFANYSVIEVVMILSSLGAVVTLFKTWSRTPEVKSGFWLFISLSMIVGMLASNVMSNFQLFVILTLYCSLYIGRIMRGHLIDGVERSTDYITPILLLLLHIPAFTYGEYIFNIITMYLLICIAILIIKTFSVLKMYWVWLNLRT